MDAAVFDAVKRFINAGTWEARRSVFGEFADLLRSPEALHMLNYNAADARHEPSVRRALSARIRLLERSRQEIEAIYADRDRLHDAVDRFVNARSQAERQAIAESSRTALFSVGADQVFADLLLQDRDADEQRFIEACWNELEEIRKGARRVPISKAAPASRDSHPDTPLEAFLSAERWSAIQRLLETATNDLFSPLALEAIETRAKKTSTASGELPRIKARLQLLRAAHRFGIIGAYAFAQGFGQGGQVVPSALMREFRDAVQDGDRLNDICDRHPILISIYRKMNGEDPTGPLPPPRLPLIVGSAASALMEMLKETSPALIIDRLTPVLDDLDPRLYPGLWGAIRLRRGDARAKLDKSAAGLSSVLEDLDAARVVFTADRFPIDHGETALYAGRALLAGGHADKALAEFDTALKYLSVAAREDRLLMAVAPRSVDEIGALRARAELLEAEALWKARRHGEAQERAQEIEARHDGSAPEVAAEACLLQVHLAQSQEGLDADDRISSGERACRRGLNHLHGVESASDTALRLQVQLIHLLLRSEAHKLRERVAEAEALLEDALRSAKAESRATAELKLVEHELVTGYARKRGWKTRARACAREILRLADILHDPALEAEGNERMGEVAPATSSLTYYRRAADQFGKLGQRENQADALRRIGDRHFDAQEWAAAVEAYDEARAVEPRLDGEPTDAFARSSKTSGLFPRAAYAAHKIGRHADALLCSEAGKARFLRQRAAGRAHIDGAVPWFLSGVVGDGLLVMPVVTSHGTITFVVPGNARSVSADHVVETAANHRAWNELLTAWMNAYFNFTAQRDIPAWESVVGRMCERLWGLLMDDVRQRIIKLGGRRGLPVLFVPPNLLAPLPFHAARDSNGTCPFIDDHPLAYAPGISPLQAHAGHRAASSPKALAFIDPDGDLPFSSYELRCLKRYVPRRDLRAYEGKRAEHRRFFELASKVDYLHFACHGFHQWAKPLETGVKVADGGLGALQFLNSEVDLRHLRLASLSACETGISTAFRRLYGNTMTYGGEEYVGLPGAFHAAGAQYVLSTLWPVEDYVATLFFEEFYRLHLAEKIDCFDAFCSARKWLRNRTAADTLDDIRQRLSERGVRNDIADHLRDIETLVRHEYEPGDKLFAHPNCWAAFVLSGSPHARQAKSS